MESEVRSSISQELGALVVGADSLKFDQEIGFDAEQALEVGPTQEAEKAIATLERESLNFLAYVSIFDVR